MKITPDRRGEAHLVDDHLMVRATGSLEPAMSAGELEGLDADVELQIRLVFRGRVCEPFIEPGSAD